jgi:hypothetical protein
LEPKHQSVAEKVDNANYVTLPNAERTLLLALHSNTPLLQIAGLSHFETSQ